jgi:hypothetical protein|tara:strand:+ start:52 stop:1077 length:1026 start_codon:yes stop_codon:yes gene_type:complete
MTYQSKDMDIKMSLEKNPPIYPTGVTQKKRIRVQRKLCTWPETQEFRVQGKNISNIHQLKDSYLVNGIIYEEPVQVVEVDPNNKDRFIGIAGYHRNAAQELLGWDIAIYDIVEFKTPRDRLKFGYTSNHHLPAQKTDKNDIKKGITKGITDGIIKNDNNDIRGFLKEIAADKTDTERNSILKSWRLNYSAYENLEAFGSIAANSKAEELNIPHLGDKGVSSSGLYGYIKEPGGYKTVMHDGLKLWLSENEDIHLTGYITNPNPKQLRTRREGEKNSIDKLNNFLYDVAAKLTDIPVDEIKAKGKSPFKYNGFLPQVISADPGKDGLPVENTKVDFDGKPML